MKEAASIQVATVGQTRPGFRIHPRAAPSRAGCVTIVRGFTAAYPEISLLGIVPGPGRRYARPRG